MMDHHWDASQQRNRYVIRSNNTSLQQEDDSEEEHDEDNEESENVATMNEDEVTRGNNANILNLLESMRLQQEENSSLVNERLATLSNRVRVHSE